MSIKKQLELAQVLGIPKSKLDMFLSLTTKRPIKSIIDLDKILTVMMKKSGMNRATSNAIMDRYIAQIDAPSITAGSSLGNVTNNAVSGISSKKKSMGKAVSANPSSATKRKISEVQAASSSTSKRQTSALPVARSASRHSGGSVRAMPSALPVARSASHHSGGSVRPTGPTTRKYDLRLIHALSKPIHLNSSHIIVGNSKYPLMTNTHRNLVKQIPNKLATPLGAVLATDIHHPTKKERGKITNLNSLIKAASMNGRSARKLATAMNMKIPKVLHPHHREKIHLAALHFAQTGHLSNNIRAASAPRGRPVSVATDPFKRLRQERDGLVKAYGEHKSPELLGQIENLTKSMERLVRDDRLLQAPIERELDILSATNESFQKHIDRITVLEAELKKMKKSINRKEKILDEYDTHLFFGGNEERHRKHHETIRADVHQIVRNLFPSAARGILETSQKTEREPVNANSSYNGRNGGTSSGRTNGQSSSGRSASGRTASGITLSGRSASGRTTSGRTASGITLSGRSASGRTASGRTVSGRTASGRTASGRTASGRTASGYTGVLRGKSGVQQWSNDGANSRLAPGGGVRWRSGIFQNVNGRNTMTSARTSPKRRKIVPVRIG